MNSQKNYWFRAKKFGWGWGLPIRWQGWLVLAASVALIALIRWIFPPAIHPAGFFGGVAVVMATLIAVFWLTGEPPRWRSGNDAR
jgi:hypothetical protein